jgi:hypothetical protein
MSEQLNASKLALDVLINHEGNYELEKAGAARSHKAITARSHKAITAIVVDLQLELLGAYEEEQRGRFGDHVRGLLNVQAKLKEKNT